jgi:excisionase family DNA binding protein
MVVNSSEIGMLTIREVSQMLNVHTNTLRRWTEQGVLKTVRIGPRGDCRFRLEDIVRLLYVGNLDT